jgi:hypothetical protein
LIEGCLEASSIELIRTHEIHTGAARHFSSREPNRHDDIVVGYLRLIDMNKYFKNRKSDALGGINRWDAWRIVPTSIQAGAFPRETGVSTPY